MFAPDFTSHAYVFVTVKQTSVSPSASSLGTESINAEKDVAFRAAATTILMMSSPVSETTSASRSRRSDIAAVIRGRIETQLPSRNAGFECRTASSWQFRIRNHGRNSLGPSLLPLSPPARYRLEPVSLRFGVEHGVLGCVSAEATRLAATSSRTII